MKQIALILIPALLGLASSLHAQGTWKDSIYVYARIVDSFTYELLKGDSLSYYRTNGEEYNFMRRLHRETKQLHLYIKSKGYEPLDSTVQLKVGRRERYIYLPDIKLKKLPQHSEMQMEEVVIEATKIRMVVRGDTVIYSADAFQLSDGSMLDGLLRRLPGFELENGRISVNGQFVSSLLVNGNDFFKGDPRIALENLPAYMVQKVKVYRREPEYAYISKPLTKDELPLVVDVNLKREYAVGWVANGEGGYGTHDRYKGRLFGLRFTDHSRLALFGNANNLGDTNRPGTSGDWKSQGSSTGRTALQTAGVEALVDDKHRVWKYQGNARVQHQRTEAATFVASETFQGAAQSIFARQQQEQLLRNLGISTDHTFSLRRPRNHTTLMLNGSYLHGKEHGEQQRSEYDANPSADSVDVERALINHTRRQSRQWCDTWRGSGSYSGFISVPHTRDYIRLKATADYEHRTSAHFNDYHLSYAQASADRRYQYATSPESRFTATAEASYSYCDDWGNLQPYVSLSEQYAKGDHSLYRLDRLSEQPPFGVLPSTLHNVPDNANSYASQSNNLTTKAGLETVIWLNDGKQNLLLKPEIQWRRDRLSYRRGTLDVHPQRSSLLFTPELAFRFDNFKLAYLLTYAEPDLLSLQPYRDDADPLNLRQGNPNLQRSIHHSLDWNYGIYKRQHNIKSEMKAYARLTQHVIAHAIDLDVATGVRTHMPRNVEGNWAAGGSFYYHRHFGEGHRFFVNTTTALDYQNSVDHVSARSVVRNLNLRQQLRFLARVKQNALSAKATLRYLHAVSAQETFRPINSFDLTYAATFERPLWWGIYLVTAGTLYQRVGYADRSMNELRFVADAHLSKSLLKGRLCFSLDAYDIFNGQSNITKTLNAQGQTETWNNTLPSYIMLSVSWKMSKKPQKNNREVGAPGEGKRITFDLE